jgi:hypothetical protein
MPEPIFIELDTYIIPFEPISTAYFINHSHRNNQQCGLTNGNVLSASLREHSKVLFLPVSDTKITVNEGKGKIISVTGHEDPYGCDTSRLPHFLDDRFTEGGYYITLCGEGQMK